MDEAIIQINHITKKFTGVTALKDLTLSFYKGKVNVLLGENGAGKSTLIKILAGIYSLDEGEIYYKGQKTVWKDASDALNHGISVIHQELSVVNDLTVSENIFLGREVKKRGLIKKNKMNEAAQELMKRLRLSINPKAKVMTLSAAEKQMVEITRAISYDAEVVIMDEPTSSLTIAETETLFDVIEELKRKNVCIIYISHRMSEIKRIGDTVAILKDGALVDVVSAKNTDEADWIKMMVGRDIHRIDIGENHIVEDAVILSVKNLSACTPCRNISFDLHKGEILGISGLVGSGRTELLRTIFGADKKIGGEYFIQGEKVKISNTTDAIAHKIGLIPEDRRKQGILLGMNIVENIALPNLKNWVRKRLVDDNRAKATAKKYIDKLDVKVASLKAATKYMSGGNQQKVVLSKWLAANCSVLLMDEPTRGIDVNAKNEIYSLMLEFVKNGGSIIMVSSELPEILGISDRIIVMREGAMAATLERNDATEEKILSLASI